jgi:hypothetical protein
MKTELIYEEFKLEESHHLLQLTTYMAYPVLLDTLFNF